ncbi:MULTISPECIES: type II secretion system protein [Ramlibacter]|jgi:general secretion pathway protein G|uniref:Prepilin-type N-terminal cleavage/methylation domain-containing protein n=1 Tax=Ramlibacter pinisoli TaxID=2682844 RepID=A0A6N8J0L2_9BURK|nr:MULTISPECIES: type II secretion system protein [Ramlibacter]MBA2961851.1 type II secretion system protein [Ramlibacter sp. CGMCC 1.13660]MVQ31793.1 prepilin-type N-terminal cleavage/methylation domain-containing protein [Ramlibacter pinisoli]
MDPRRNRRPGGFTLIELMIVLAIVATLLTIAVPSYFGSLDNARETSLRKSLSVMREAIDQYHSDRNKYPDTLQELVTARYLRSIPPDPVTGASDQWVFELSGDEGQRGLRDVHSAAPGNGRDGTPYASW